MSINADKIKRLEAANALITKIASCGRRFFEHKGAVSHLFLDRRGRVWLRDKYSGREVYTHYNGRWRYFTEGGTLQCLIKHLRNFVCRGVLVPRHVLGPWPDWCSEGDPWAYGADMATVRESAATLGLVAPVEGGAV